MRIYFFHEIFPVLCIIRRNKIIIYSNIHIHSRICRYPMKGTFNFPIRSRRPTTRVKIHGTMNFLNATIIIFYHFITTNNICPFKPYLFPRCHTEKLLYRSFHKIFSFNINISTKRHLTTSHRFIFRIILNH